MPDPTPIPECSAKPLKYQDWQKEFCPTDNIECTAEDAFATAVSLGSPEIDTVKALLKGENLDLSADLTKVQDLKTGKERPAQDVLTRLVYKQGRAGALPQCQANPRGVVSIVGVEKPCQDVLDEVINYLYSQGYSPTSEKGVYRRGTMAQGVNKTLAQAAKELDMAGPTLLKLYQSAISKMHLRQANYQKLLTGFQEGLNLQAKVSNVNPLAPVVGCYATTDPKVTLCITQDPVEIALKSTGRCWEGRSCERITGVFSEGFIDDIAHHAAIAFAVKADTGEVIGRKMIRWGVDRSKEGMTLTEMELAVATRPEKVKFCAGLEPIWYETGMTQKQQVALDERIVEVLQCNKLAAETCVTPYGYRGYSDAMGAGNISSIYYSAPGVERRGEYLIGYLKAFYRDNVPFIFKVERLTNAQVNLLRQHDFEWANAESAAEAFYTNAHHNELPFHIIRNLEDLAERFNQCEEPLSRPLTNKELFLIEKLAHYLNRPLDVTGEVIGRCLSEKEVLYLLARFTGPGDIHGTLFLNDEAGGHNTYELFTADTYEYQETMDGYLNAQEDQFWGIVEEKFGTTWEP